jgi:hypothetical protein
MSHTDPDCLPGSAAASQPSGRPAVDARTSDELELLLDEALAATFPASDPIAAGLGRPALVEPQGNLPVGHPSDARMLPVEHHPLYPMWKTALARLIQLKERCQSAHDDEKPMLNAEYEDALTAYVAIADDL